MSEDEKEAKLAKVKAWHSSFEELVSQRAALATDPEAAKRVLAVSHELLLAIVNSYSLWNLRREALAALNDADVLQAEFALNNDLVLRDMKSYNAWHHRQWAYQQLDARGVDISASLTEDLELCRRLLSYDARNFHCWNYRRFVLARLGHAATDDAEYAFTEDKVGEGHQFFSGEDPSKLRQNSMANYSAWHQRSLIVTRRLDALRGTEGEADARMAALCAELDFAEPFAVIHTGESPWRYIEWILGQAQGEQAGELDRRVLEVCEEVIRLDLEEQKEFGKPPKWPMSIAAVISIRLGEKDRAREKLTSLSIHYPLQKGRYCDLIEGLAK